MTKFIISWNCGYGDEYEVIESESIGGARDLAYECWREGVENNADYTALEYSEELAEELGL